MVVKDACHNLSFRAHRVVGEAAIEHQRLVVAIFRTGGITMNGEEEVGTIGISLVAYFRESAVVGSGVGGARHRRHRSLGAFRGCQAPL